MWLLFRYRYSWCSFSLENTLCAVFPDRVQRDKKRKQKGENMKKKLFGALIAAVA